MSVTITLMLALTPAPTAIVDSAVGVHGLEPFELLEPGRTVFVGGRGRVRLAYFASCVHETVAGGTIRVGVTASLTDDASIERTTGDCTLGRTEPGRIGVPAALVLRDGARARSAIRRVSTRFPWLVLTACARVSIHRSGEAVPLLNRSFPAGVTPLASAGVELEADATYEFCAHGRCLPVLVDPKPGPEVPFLERIVPLVR